jgi:hypothetical protein
MERVGRKVGPFTFYIGVTNLTFLSTQLCPSFSSFEVASKNKADEKTTT